MEKNEPLNLPACAEQFLAEVVRRMRCRKRVREEVRQELVAHFEDELRDCADVPEREQRAQRLIEEFGDAKLLAVLCRRAKKRCQPLWAKMLVHGLQAIGVWILLLSLYMVWFFSGKPNVRVDYLAILSQKAQPRAGEQENAWPHYERAIELLVQEPNELGEVEAFRYYVSAGARDLSGFTDPERRALEDWLVANRPAWEEFAAGVTKPYCWRQYEPGAGGARGPSLLNVDMAGYAQLRRFAFLGIWRSRVHFHHGRVSDALEDCLIVARAGSHWQRLPLLMEQLLGHGLSSMAHAEILRLIERRTPSPEALATLQRGLSELYPQQYPLADIEERWLTALDVVQHEFTDGGPGGGHLVYSFSDIVESARVSMGLRSAKWLQLPDWKRMFLHPRRNQAVAKAREMFERQRRLVRLTPYERRNREVAVAEETSDSLPEYGDVLVNSDVFWEESIVTRNAFHSKAMHEATLTIVALLRHRQEKGLYPASLEELIGSGYLQALPCDPYGSGALSYRRGNSDFVLYSLGPDFDDDGGILGETEEGRIPNWLNHGDTVFWPVIP